MNYDHSVYSLGSDIDYYLPLVKSWIRAYCKIWCRFAQHTVVQILSKTRFTLTLL